MNKMKQTLTLDTTIISDLKREDKHVKLYFSMSIVHENSHFLYEKRTHTSNKQKKIIILPPPLKNFTNSSFPYAPALSFPETRQG